MEAEHFEDFVSLLTGIYRDIQKLKERYSKDLGLKTVHVFWLYLLSRYPEGMSASELARASKSTRALLSREIGELTERALITYDRKGERRRYGWKFVLTENGRACAAEIRRIAFGIQQQASAGISEEDLLVFYRTLRALLKNFDRLAEVRRQETEVLSQ